MKNASKVTIACAPIYLFSYISVGLSLSLKDIKDCCSQQDIFNSNSQLLVNNYTQSICMDTLYFMMLSLKQIIFILY